MNYSFYLIILFLLFTIVFVTYMDLIGYSIFGLFTQIKEPFDRLIVNWTGLARFDWYSENSTVRTFTGGINLGFKATTVDELLIEQGYNRQESILVKNKTNDFISFFLKIYEKQNTGCTSFPTN